jgi:hypothetical protein
MRKFQLLLAFTALAVCVALAAFGFWLHASILITLVAVTLNKPTARLCAVTLSVPEILKDVLSAFKLETPELFQPGGFSTDFSSNSAVLGDKITAKISHVPIVGDYDENDGGFEAAAQDVTTLIEDIPIILDGFKAVTVEIGWLTSLATKDVNLAKAATDNLGYALGKYVVDTILNSAVVGVSNSVPLIPNLANLDSFENLRDQLNSQKVYEGGRFCFVNTAIASALGADDRVRSELFYGQKNGETGLRRWKDIAGFKWIREYPDLFAGQAGNLGGLAGDRRLACVAIRKMLGLNNLLDELRAPKVMDFHNLRDEQSGAELLGISWQQSGTGKVFFSAAVLFGFAVGNRAGAPLTGTDAAGCLIRTI